MPKEFDDYSDSAPVPIPVLRKWLGLSQPSMWRIKHRPDSGFPVDEIFLINGIEYVPKRAALQWIAELAREGVRRRVGRTPRELTPVERAERALQDIKQQLKGNDDASR